jgi:hypothetical protein
VRIDAVLIEEVDAIGPEGFREPSTARAMCSGPLLSPRTRRLLGSMSKPNVVAMTTRSRTDASASPTNSSLV